MKKVSRAVIVFAVLLYTASGNAQAAEEVKVSAPAVVGTPAVVKAAPAAAPETVKAPDAKTEDVSLPAGKQELSKEDMAARVREMCQYHPDVIPAVPGLAVKEVDGKKTYEFNGKKLEDLDKDTITNIFREASRFISFQNTQRFEQQMKTIKQIDDINKMQRSFRKPYNPNIPKTYTPPKTYAPPKPYKAPGKY